jgi:C_GCAxxG_C_C family probable redox protein
MMAGFFLEDFFNFNVKTDMIIAIEEKAITTFRAGLNCAQAVLTAYSDEMSFDENLALSVSCGFGGGMGRLQETCGAVTGSYMVLGVYNCKKFADNQERKEKTYAMIQKFSNKFKEINGSTDCIELIKCDLKTEEGHLYAKDNNLFERVCEKCISDSVRIVNQLIDE